MRIIKRLIKSIFSTLALVLVFSLPFYVFANSVTVDSSPVNSNLLEQINSGVNSLLANLSNKTSTIKVASAQASVTPQIKVSGFKNLVPKLVSYGHSLGSAMVQAGNLIGQLADQTYTKEQNVVRNLVPSSTISQINSQTTAVISTSPVSSPTSTPSPVLNNNQIAAIASPTPTPSKKVTAPVKKSPTPTPLVKNNSTPAPTPALSQSSNNIPPVALVDLRNDLNSLKALVATLPRSTIVIGQNTTSFVPPAVSGGNITLNQNSISTSGGDLTLAPASLDVSVTSNLSIAGTLSVSGVTSLGDNATVKGSLTVGSFSQSNASVSNNLEVVNIASIGGNIITKGRLGIGVSAPTSVFYINDTNIGSISTSSFVIRSSNTVGSVASISATSLTSGDALYIKVPNQATTATFTGDIIDANNTSGVDLFTVTGKGWVGLGNIAAPKGPLFINDTNIGSISSGSFAIRSSNTVGSIASISATSLTTGNVIKITISSSQMSTGNILSVVNNNKTSALTYFTMTGRGYFGIGTSTPKGPLYITDTNAGSTSSGSFSVVSSNTVGTAASISANSINTGNGFTLSLNGLTSGKGMNITSTGTVITPGSIFSIKANSLTTGTVASISATGLTSGNALTIKVASASTFTGNIFNITNNNRTSAATLLNMTGRGYFGLGTSTPTGTFYVADTTPGSTATGSFSIKSSNTTASVASISATSLSTGNVIKITIATSSMSTGNILSVVNNNKTSALTYFTMTGRGYFGIGTATPRGPLFVVDANPGSTATGSFAIRSSGTTGNAASISATSLTSGDALYIQVPNNITALTYTGDIIDANTTTGVDLFTVTGKGRLGLGNITAPKGLFFLNDTLTGSISSGSFAIRSSNTVGSIASISATSLTSGNALSIIVASASTFTGNILSIANNNRTSQTTWLTMTGRGYFGIGTSAPKGPLYLVDSNAGSTSTSSFSIRSSAATGSIASISSTTLTSGNVFNVIATTSTFTGNVFNINAKNMAGGAVFNISIPASSSTNSPHGLLVATDANGSVIASWSMGGNLALRGKIFSRGAQSTCVGVNNPSAGCLDYAETYSTRDSTIGAADLVAVDPENSQSIIKATKNSGILGIVSTNPAALINGQGLVTGASTLDPRNMPEGQVPVALAGRVPLKVSTENGPIKIGDYLRASPDTPGVAMKAQKAGQVIGQAMENYSGSDIGQVITFLEPGYYNGKNLEDIAGSFDPSSDSGLANALITQFMHQTSPSSTDMSDIVADRIAAAIEIISPKIYTDSLFTNKIETKMGITTYDEQTNQPYCISVSAGQIKTTPGGCGNPNALNLLPSGSIPNLNTPTPTPSPTDTPEPSSTPDIATPSPTEISSPLPVPELPAPDNSSPDTTP